MRNTQHSESKSKPLDHPYPSRPFRLYIALTNACNRLCPWCSTYSGPKKTSFISFDKFTALLPPYKQFELQLEGGEPYLHPRLLEFIQVAERTGRCTKLIISTNGSLLPFVYDGESLDWRGSKKALLRHIAGFPTNLVLKVSLNHHLYEHDPLLFEKASLLQQIFSQHLNQGGRTLVFNVRRRYDVETNDDAWILQKIESYGLTKRANVFYLQAYGRYKGHSKAQKPFLVGHNFQMANPDGQIYGTDLEARSEAMGRLP